jgi:hypothetical protein
MVPIVPTFGPESAADEERGGPLPNLGGEPSSADERTAN